jgi:hypothetical protein
LAYDWVAPIYDWFTEEYDIADPQDAQAFRCEPGWLYLAERQMSSGHLPNCLEPATCGHLKVTTQRPEAALHGKSLGSLQDPQADAHDYDEVEIVLWAERTLAEAYRRRMRRAGSASLAGMQAKGNSQDCCRKILHVVYSLCGTIPTSLCFYRCVCIG